MRRFLSVPSVLCIASALLAQSSAPFDNKPNDPNSSAPCIVTGRVVTAAEGNPLKSARVSLIPEHQRSHNEIHSVSSDTDGHFTLRDVPPGRYRFFAAHPGFVEQHYKAGINDDGPIFSIKSGEKVSDVLFRLVTAAVITGRVSNEDGEPMQRIEVVALRRPSEEEIEDIDVPRLHKIEMERVSSAESDDRGLYRIFGLKPGEYFVKAEDSLQARSGYVDESYFVKQSLGSEFGSVYYPGVTQTAQAQVIPIKAGEEAQADITMRRVKTVEIAGRVIGPTGPDANAMIRLESADGTGSDFNRHDTTDEKGNFRFRNIPEGTYYVVAYQRQAGTFSYEQRARQKVEVTGDNIDALTISLGTGVTIQGRLKLEGSGVSLDRIHLALASVEDDGLAGGRSDVKKDGSFEFNSVRDDSYAITVWGLDRDAYVKSAMRGPDDLLEKGVQVEGSSSGKIELALSSDGAQLEGVVSDDEGPAIGARVRLVPDSLTPYNHLRVQRATTDQLGHFSITNIAPGKYKLRARAMASSEAGAYKAEPRAVTLSENDRQTMEIKLQKAQE